MGGKERKVGGEISRLLPTLVDSVFQRTSIENPPLFPAIRRAKKGAIYPRCGLSARITENIFYPLLAQFLSAFGGRLPYAPATRYFALTIFLRTCLLLNVNY